MGWIKAVIYVVWYLVWFQSGVDHDLPMSFLYINVFGWVGIWTGKYSRELTWQQAESTYKLGKAMCFLSCCLQFCWYGGVFMTDATDWTSVAI